MLYYSKTTEGFYDPTIHRCIPPDAVEISDEQHSALLYAQTQGQKINPNSNGYPVAVDPPAPLLLDLKAAAVVTINMAAGTARARYITIVAGQEATYTEKARQCEAYKAAGYPVIPDPVAHAYVIAERNARGGNTTLQEACDAILDERDKWIIKGAKIEEIRRTAKIAIAAAVDKTEIEQAKAIGLEGLKTL